MELDLTNGVPGVTAPSPTTYEEFWPAYLSGHLHPATRAAHVVGNSLTIVGAAGALCWRGKRLPWLAVIISSQGLTVFSHHYWEKNRDRAAGPRRAHPPRDWIWKANGRLLRLAFTGKLEPEVQAVRRALGMTELQMTLHDLERTSTADRS